MFLVHCVIFSFYFSTYDYQTGTGSLIDFSDDDKVEVLEIFLFWSFSNCSMPVRSRDWASKKVQKIFLSFWIHYLISIEVLDHRLYKQLGKKAKLRGTLNGLRFEFLIHIFLNSLISANSLLDNPAHKYLILLTVVA